MFQVCNEYDREQFSLQEECTGGEGYYWNAGSMWIGDTPPLSKCPLEHLAFLVTTENS